MRDEVKDQGEEESNGREKVYNGFKSVWSHVSGIIRERRQGNSMLSLPLSQKGGRERQGAREQCNFVGIFIFGSYY